MAWFRIPLFLCLVLLPVTGAVADLRVFPSRHYRVNTDLEAGFAQDLARRLDGMYDEYSRRLMQFETDPNQPRADVYLYTARDRYLRFVGPGMRSSGGVFMSSRNALATFSDGQGRDNLRRTLQHEAFHQFAANTIHYPLPMWLNEGIAQYFEEGLWTGDGFVLGQIPPRRVRQLQADIHAGRLLDTEKLLSMSPDQWAKALTSRSATRGATQYNQAWAVVHFLLNSTYPTDGGKTEPMRPRFIRLLRLIHEGTDPDQAFVLAFSGNYPGFQDRFLEWAATLQPTVEATYIERQEVLADMLVAMHSYGRWFDDIETFRNSVARAGLEIQYSKGQIKWSSGKDTSLYFSRIDGDLFGPTELYVQPRRSAPLSDVVCRCLPKNLLRTRFYKVADRIEHEVLIESTAPPARPMTGPMTAPVPR